MSHPEGSKTRGLLTTGVAIWLTRRRGRRSRPASAEVDVSSEVPMNSNRRIPRCHKTSLATALKYSVTINACLIGGPGISLILPCFYGGADQAADEGGICGKPPRQGCAPGCRVPARPRFTVALKEPLSVRALGCRDSQSWRRPSEDRRHGGEWPVVGCRKKRRAPAASMSSLRIKDIVRQLLNQTKYLRVISLSFYLYDLCQSDSVYRW